MANVNKVILIGNLTRDPELRYTPSGTPVAEFGLAVNRVWTGKDGQRHEEVTFVDITLWARQAEIASEYLSKGRQVYIEGRLQLDQWETPDGQKRSRLRVVGENMQLLGGRPDGRSRQSSSRRDWDSGSREPASSPSGSSRAGGDVPPGSEGPGEPDDEIPF